MPQHTGQWNRQVEIVSYYYYSQNKNIYIIISNGVRFLFTARIKHTKQQSHQKLDTLIMQMKTDKISAAIQIGKKDPHIF